MCLSIDSTVFFFSFQLQRTTLPSVSSVVESSFERLDVLLITSNERNELLSNFLAQKARMSLTKTNYKKQAPGEAFETDKIASVQR